MPACFLLHHTEDKQLMTKPTYFFSNAIVAICLHFATMRV